MINFNVVPKSGFNKQLSSGSVRSAMEIIIQKLALKANNILVSVSKLLVDVFNNTDVAKALRGQGVDLPAHFGLTDSQASALADGMADLIYNSVTIKVDQNNPKLFINILAVSTEWEKYAALPGGEYVSKPSNITIPVAKWLLIDPNIDIGQAAYSITFDGNKVDMINSRSGRALMVEIESIAGENTPYVLPSIVFKKSGNNFIEYAIGQPNVAKQVMDILITNLQM